MKQLFNIQKIDVIPTAPVSTDVLDSTRAIVKMIKYTSLSLNMLFDAAWCGVQSRKVSTGK